MGIEKSEPAKDQVDNNPPEADFVDERAQLMIEMETTVLLEWFKDNYDLEFQLMGEETSKKKYKMFPDTPKACLDKLKVVREEIVKIPPAFFRELKIKKVIITGQILKWNLKRSSPQSPWLELGGTYSVKEHTIYCANPNVFLHEVGHAIYHYAQSKFKNIFKKDIQNWSSLSYMKDLNEDITSYISTVFHLDGGGKFLYENIPHFKLQQLRIVKIQELLNKWSKGLFNPEYWALLEVGQIDEEYWKSKGLW